jgi:SAM-dependent methyltransferase
MCFAKYPSAISLDVLLMPRTESSSLTPEQLRLHFDVEKELATRLRNSTREERRTLVPELYSELYRRVPCHPRTLRSDNPEASARSIASQMRLLKPFLTPTVQMVEFGAGDGALSRNVATLYPQSRVTALEVCVQSGAAREGSENFSWVLHDGLSVPLPDQSMDVAFSYQVLEHMHPDDVNIHLAEVYRLLKPGGVYVFSTPHEASGPHDVSRHFGLDLETFHLREWSYRDLERDLAGAGFSHYQPYWRGVVQPMRGSIHRLIRGLEAGFTILPRSLSVRLARRCLNNVVLVATR